MNIYDNLSISSQNENLFQTMEEQAKKMVFKINSQTDPSQSLG